MSTKVKLTNRTRTAKTYNLTVATAPHRMEVERRVDDREGNVRKETRRLMVPDSITLLAGETRIVPTGYLSAPEIKAALQRRELVRSAVETPETAPVLETGETPAESADETSAETPRSRSRRSAG